MSGHVSRFGGAAGLAGAVVAAVTLGISGAQVGVADQRAEVALTSGSADSTELLVIAIANFLDAHDVITGIDTSDSSDSLLNAAATLRAFPSILDRAVTIVDQGLAPAQAVILANTGSLSSLIDQLFLAPLNQQWLETSESMFDATQALDAAFADGSIEDVLSAQFQLLGLSFFELIPLSIASVPVAWIGAFVEDAVAASDFFDSSF